MAYYVHTFAVLPRVASRKCVTSQPAVAEEDGAAVVAVAASTASAKHKE